VCGAIAPYLRESEKLGADESQSHQRWLTLALPQIAYFGCLPKKLELNFPQADFWTVIECGSLYCCASCSLGC
jgi:hypothetical protein